MRNAFRLSTAAIAMSALLVAMGPAASAEPPPCPSGWDEVTRTGVVDLPLFQRGIEEGLFTAEELQAGFDSFDGNGNAILCVKTTPSRTLPHPYKISDDRGTRTEL
jgi:hypothetical protein